MSEPLRPEGEATAPPTLDALRQQGAQRHDPVRFHQLEALARRLPQAAPDLRPLLQTKLHTALQQCAQRLSQAQAAARAQVDSHIHQHPALSAERRAELQRLCAEGDVHTLRRLTAPGAPARDAAARPLARLNQHLQHITTPPLGAGVGPRPELKSVQRFRLVWAQWQADQQVNQAIVQRPGNAGPLNSHLLVVRSLARMRELSPDYLQRFMAHLDTLLWLDQAQQKNALPSAKAARRGRAKK